MDSLRRRAQNEHGFSTAEIAVTLGILAVLVLSMSAALSSGFRYLLTSKQRAAAVAAANALVERARAVARSDFGSLGLVPGDLAGDANIVSGTCGGQTAQMFSGEPVVTAGTADTNPLNPHVRTTTVGQSAVTIKVYVTGVTPGGCSATTPAYKRITVLASWAKAASGVSNEVRLATYLFDAAGGGAGSLGTGGAGQDDDGDGAVDEDGPDDDGDGQTNEDPLDGIDNDGDGAVDEDCTSGCAGADGDGDGQTDEDCVSGCGGGGGNPPYATFEGEARVAGGNLHGDNVSPLLIPPPTATTVFLSKTAAQGESVGVLTRYSGTAISVLAEAGGQTASHEASSLADNDPATAAPDDPSPACASGSWSDFAGGLVNNNLVSSGQSCSRLNDPSDQLPLSTSSATYSSAPAWTSAVPAAGSVPATSVANFVHGGATSAVSTVDALGSGGTQSGLASTSSLTTGALEMNRFNVLGFNAAQGSLRMDAGTWTAVAQAGAGIGAGASALSGTVTYRIYDPDETLPGCSSRSGGYCVRSANPAAPGFTGIDDTSVVVLNSTNLLGVVTARITLTSTMQIPAPATEVRTDPITGSVTYAKVASQLPKATSVMLIESPAGVTISTITSTADLGQLVSWAAYTP